MAKTRVFIGYDYDNDKLAKDRLLGWDVNKNSISLRTTGLDVAVDSEEAVAIKQDLTAPGGHGKSERGRDEKEACGRQDRFD